MKIGILGTGNIGKTLIRRLSAAGHEVKAANSRGPETIEADVLASGGRAVTAAEAVVDIDVVILSIPFASIAQVAPLIAKVPDGTVVLDTSNYFPFRDTEIAAIEAGQPESVWASEQLGRPIVKAWNSIGAESFAHRSRPAGSADRIALPMRPTVRESVSWRWHSLRTPGSMPSMRGRSRNRGVSSPAHPVTARISPVGSCRTHWRRPTRRGHRSGATSGSPWSRNASGPASNQTGNTLSV
ncbi:NADPH-dependent F420 reductase [[Kitasatospora] papulosa]